MTNPEHDPGNKTDMQVDFQKMLEGNLDGGFFIVYVGQSELDKNGFQDAKKKAIIKFNAIKKMVEKYPERIVLVKNPSEVYQAKREEKLFAAIGIENGYVIGKDVEEQSLNKGFIKNARLYQVKNETFPYIELSNDFTEKVECLVVNDLQNEDIDKIQFFESTEYQLENIDCEIDNEIKNYQYLKLIRPNKTQNSWNFHEWQKKFEDYDCECAKLWMELFDEYKHDSEKAEIFWPEILQKIKKK